MMEIRYFSLIVGLLFLFIGILGFLPPAVHAPPPDAPEIAMKSGYGYLLGVFPVNALHNLVHLGIGLWGIIVSRHEWGSRRFAQSLTVIYGALAVMGLIPLLKTTFGLIPIFGYDVWLHALTAAVASYFGFSQQRRIEMPSVQS